MMNRSGENGNPCFVPNLRRNAFNLFTIKYVNCKYFVAYLLSDWVNASISSVLRASIMNGCWIYIFLNLDQLISSCGFSYLDCWYDRLYWLIFDYWTSFAFLECWIRLANILLRIFASIFMENISLYFSIILCHFFVKW